MSVAFTLVIGFGGHFVASGIRFLHSCIIISLKIRV
jgi:hypothetical protein